MDMGIADDFQGKFKRATIQQGGAGTLAASSYLCPGVASHFMLARAAEMRKLKTDWLGLHNYNDLWWCGATNRIKRNHFTDPSVTQACPGATRGARRGTTPETVAC